VRPIYWCSELGMQEQVEEELLEMLHARVREIDYMRCQPATAHCHAVGVHAFGLTDV
jgi:hypothetical protein